MDVLNSTTIKPMVIKDSKGYNLIREVCLLSFLAIGLILNVLAFAALRKLAKTNGHYVIVMGLISSNIVCNTTLLFLIPFTVRNLHRPILFAIMFPLSLSTYLVSVSHIACISVERLVAVVKPLHYRKLFSGGRMKLTVVAVWFIAIISHNVIVFAHVNAHERKSPRHIRFVVFRPYLTVYYTVGLSFTFAVYIILLVCMGFGRKMISKKVSPFSQSCSVVKETKINDFTTTDTDFSSVQAHITNQDNDLDQESGKQTPSKENSHPNCHLNDKNTLPFCPNDVTKGRNSENDVNNAGPKPMKFGLKSSDSYPMSLPSTSDVNTDPISTISTCTTISSKNQIRKLREPRTVMTIGLLILVHLLTGLCTLVSYGIIGENALAHPELFGLPIFMTLTNSLFDPFFYVISSKEVRTSMGDMFKVTFYQIKNMKLHR